MKMGEFILSWETYLGKPLIEDSYSYWPVVLILCRGDVTYFDGLIETILAVGLVKPKQGIYKHLLYGI